MKNKEPLKKWDIVLVALNKQQKRPALVISPERHNLTHDIIVLFITSNLDIHEEFGDYKIHYWEAAKLPKPAVIKMNFSTVAKKHLKPLGRLTPEDIKEFEKNFSNFFNLN